MTTLRRGLITHSIMKEDRSINSLRKKRRISGLSLCGANACEIPVHCHRA